MIGVFTRHPRPLAALFGVLAIVGVIIALAR
jgi:hypothetical protein